MNDYKLEYYEIVDANRERADKEFARRAAKEALIRNAIKQIEREHLCQLDVIIQYIR